MTQDAHPGFRSLGEDAEGADTMTLVLGVTKFGHGQDGLSMSTDHFTQVRLPASISQEDVRRMQTDFELIAKALREHPDEMAYLLESHCRKDVNASRQVAANLNLSEEGFRAQGGGIVWAVVGAAVLCDVLTGCLTSWAWGPPGEGI